MFRKLFSIFVLNLFFVGTAHAFILVDTGVPPANAGGYFLRDYQWMYGKVTFDHPVHIFDIETIMSNELLTPETYTLTFLNSKNDLPNLESRYFDRQITVPGTQDASFGQFYFGNHDLSVNVGPGDYWVGLEVQAADNHTTSVPRYPPSPLSKYILFRPANTLLNPTDSDQYYDFGNEGPLFSVLIQGKELPGTVAPEPTTLLLLASGLSAMALRRRKRV